ncbi:MogA/MoaB family molybdenum cofactor biosynthesis protein [Demequina sp. SYSU T00039]|uniref:MogA/MoaB family molybdenum cofactor biosynthesis protein n=1 Tax=Demequina lignilytica TaxID=3051663 RepID=A0AAW7M8I7_9MICO|nr:MULTISPECIES: MogA/MoaB family molybdenum cofactor biosynthesis protein [unclassified Demequina]MDN4478437.1 MogA/MoaB family molybdenum cofactor biosynthesis protein [Demequina sp. SYSU T00039-1]MDN4487056.1 MogA/MoaB family molybdenum cofactor biosynthesis protein [Demequina sp. SYSU T00039]MDN4489767.1 MogA/MoaB family molybdenum cofactor biosynthesis protein [Demequina sp. SYSU T00068]
MSPDLAGVPAHVITVSDRSAAGARPDASGPILVQALMTLGAQVTARIVPDGIDSVRGAIRAAVEAGARAVVTTGGTGLAPRDLTPEATAPLLARPLPGVAERLRAVDAEAVPTAALSRGLAGVTEEGVVVVNVAGSTGAARSAAVVLGAVLPHALAQLAGGDH